MGALSSDPQGLHIIERWRMINMFYHIMDLGGRDDLVFALLGNMDFSMYIGNCVHSFKADLS